MTAQRILIEARVPGAGISLVRADGVEWEGGIGVADRDRQTPVTADTHFRVGSISKTFIAIALVQMYYDDLVELDATVQSVAPEVAIDNPWHDTAPVRVIHLLQHTSGFDDMHFNEIYNDSGDPEMPILDVLERNPHARRVRWRPASRMAYSNAGYGVAGYIVEKISGAPYEEYIAEHILKPLQMHTSSFRLTPADEHVLAQGYQDGPEPVGFPAIYLRPAGNLHSSPREMGRFVRMLLNWGELDGAFVVDPEYLGNMERTRTTLAAEHGVRNGYGSGIAWTHTLPFPVLGHGGGISGFQSVYGYSPSRDVGYVILLNRSGAAAARALDRLSSLAIRFLKRDVEPPAKPPRAAVAAAGLSQFEGFYLEANPRHQIAWPLQFFSAGRTIARDGDRLYSTPFRGEPTELIPVTDTTFRRAADGEATLVFAHDADGKMVLAGPSVYAERIPRWQVEVVRWPLMAAIAVLLSPLAALIVWVLRRRRAQPRGFWELKVALLLCAVQILVPAVALAMTPAENLGTRNPATIAVFLATLALPALVLIVPALAIGVRREDASPSLTGYAWIVAAAAAGLSAYLLWHGLIALRLWTY